MEEKMKQFVVALCLLSAAFRVGASGIRDDIDITGEKARASYAIGMTVGMDLRESGLDMDFAAFVRGFVSAMQDGEEGLIMDGMEAMELVRAAFDLAAERQTQEFRLREELFLAANADLEGMHSTESGLQYMVLVPGDGGTPSAESTVLVHYEGMLTDGTVFDSSRERGFPETIPLDMVIPGWAEAIQLMRVGGTCRFFIPSHLAYGPQGAGQVIPPYSTLVFTIELLDIVTEE
jgi:FKBP-type peptidyl-prolyl cis-trans isomerase